MTLERATKPYGIYHWDTFEEPGSDTFLIHEADTLEEAEAWIESKYAGRFGGADRVEIVNTLYGTVVKRYSVG